MGNDDSTDFAYLMVLSLGAFAAYRVWDQRIRPWLTEQWGQITEATGSSASAEQLDGLAVDAIAVAVILLPVLVLLLVLRRSLRRRKAARAEREEVRA